jgi:hypothetical protein
MRSTWKAPDAQAVSLAGQKVAAVVLMKDEAGRRVAEEALVKELSRHGVVGIASYTLASEAELKDKAKAKTIFAGKGIEGVVVMRPVGREDRVGNTPAMWSAAPYNSYWDGYHGVGWGGMYDPGYMTVKTIVTVETLVYSLKQNKLIWVGTSETTDPEEIKSFVCELTKSAAVWMRKDGVLVKAAK